MKKVFQFLVVLILSCGLWYLLFAFIAAEVNPFNWFVVGRIFYVALIVASTIFTYEDLIEDKSSVNDINQEL